VIRNRGAQTAEYGTGDCVVLVVRLAACSLTLPLVKRLLAHVGLVVGRDLWSCASQRWVNKQARWCGGVVRYTTWRR